MLNVACLPTLLLLLELQIYSLTMLSKSSLRPVPSSGFFTPPSLEAAVPLLPRITLVSLHVFPATHWVL